MSATTQPTTYSDLYTALLNAVREQTGVTATTEIAKRYIQTAHFDLYVGNGEKFHWAERRATIKTHAEYTTGTVTATIGSATLTGASTAWTTNNDHGQPNARAGGKMTIAGSDEVYEVTAVGGATTATISPEYIGSTDSGLDYRYFEDEYALASDFWKPVDARSFDDGCEIRLIGRSDFRKWMPRNRITSASIRVATIIDHPFSSSTTPVRKIRFAPPPSNTQIIPYSYVTSGIVVSSAGAAQSAFSADADEPIMPLRYRHVIVLHALREWYRDRKDDARALSVDAQYRDLLSRMVDDQDIGAQRLRVHMNRSSYVARSRSPYSGSGRAYDINNRFDNFED